MGTLIRSFRILRKNWQLTAVAVFSLAIAMALGVICCSLANTSLLAPPVGVAPGRLVNIYLRSPGEAVGSISYPDYQYYRHHNRVFSGVAALAEDVGVIRVGFGAPGQSPKPLVTVAENPVSNNYFSVLGIHPFLGRLFSPGDQRPNSPIAVMTCSRWKRLGSDRNIVGKLVGSYSIIGVTPKEFTGSLPERKATRAFGPNQSLTPSTRLA
jgi:hypothetical protein